MDSHLGCFVAIDHELHHNMTEERGQLLVGGEIFGL